MALDVETLEKSFDLVAPRGNELVDRFYRRLFETAPSTKPLFARVDMEKQKSSLLATLITLREALRDLSLVVPDLRELGARHVGYGARPEHYPIVGSVLLETMAEIGGADWKPEYTAAWAEAYKAVERVMLEGAESTPRRGPTGLRSGSWPARPCWPSSASPS
jgi:methyl-accepting chemotaxis protein